MSFLSRRKFFCLAGGSASAMILGSSCRSQQVYHTYRNPETGMPVSLAIGNVETPPFHVKKATYAIIIQFAKRLPFREMPCAIGDTAKPLGIWDCNEEQLLQADWTVRDGNKRIVAQGAFHQRGMQCVYLNDFILKYIGYFKGERGGTYTLEVKFTEDASALNACDPQLIVMRIGALDYMD
ncbi:MAG: hypothetical protein ABSA85_06210 [Terracidiphilus sp.]